MMPRRGRCTCRRVVRTWAGEMSAGLLRAYQLYALVELILKWPILTALFDVWREQTRSGAKRSTIETSPAPAQENAQQRSLYCKQRRQLPRDCDTATTKFEQSAGYEKTTTKETHSTSNIIIPQPQQSFGMGQSYSEHLQTQPPA